MNKKKESFEDKKEDRYLFKPIQDSDKLHNFNF